jgi:hypothetical protein
MRIESKSMNFEGLAEAKRYFERQLEHASIYGKVAKYDEVKLFIEDLKTKVDTIKNVYKSLPPANPETPYLLAGFQGAQFELEELIDMLSNVNKYMTETEGKLKEINKEIEERLLDRRNSESDSLLPSGYEKKRRKK